MQGGHVKTKEMALADEVFLPSLSLSTLDLVVTNYHSRLMILRHLMSSLPHQRSPCRNYYH